MRRLWTAIFALALATPSARAAESDAVDDATRSAIQKVITGQLEAMDHDDGDKAESFAAEAIRQKFPSGPAFMTMVHDHYAALLHARSRSFGAIDTSPHGPLQAMTLVAADGTVWTAIYSFEQADGAWRITGCSLRKLEGQQEI